jgi:cation:H+ antiporter
MSVTDLVAVMVFAGGVALVLNGAELFFAAVIASAARLEFSPFALTVLVSGFELENLAAGIAADAKGLRAAAAGTFLGGTTFLALAVAGLGGLVVPMRAALPRAALAWTVSAPLPLVALALDGELSRLDGALLVAWSAVALVGLARSGPSLPRAGAAAPDRRRPIVALLAGLAILTAGGEVLGEGIRRIVRHLGVSEALLGNTVVAASVEGEELARVTIAARRGRPDVALANVLGTIVHFVALNAGVISLVRPLPIEGDSLHLHLPVAASAPALLAAVVWTRGGVPRREGAVLLSAYLAYLAAAIAAAS